MDGDQQRKLKRFQDIKNDPEWIKVLADAVLNIDLNKLSDSQKKMLRDQFLDNLRDGLKPKEAIQKALKIVLCFTSNIK
jgi:hypothetical protein